MDSTQPPIAAGLWLAVSTSTEVEAVGLFDVQDGVATPRGERRERWRRGQPRRCLASVAALLDGLPKDAALRGIVVDLGPGSFTGVRLGLSVAQTLAFHDRLELCGVTTFALAREVASAPGAVVAVPSRPGHVYVDAAGMAGAAGTDDGIELPIAALTAWLAERPAAALLVASGMGTAPPPTLTDATAVALVDLGAMMRLAIHGAARPGAVPAYGAASEAERSHGIALAAVALPVAGAAVRRAEPVG